MNKKTINKYVEIHTSILEEYIDFKITVINYFLEVETNQDWWKEFNDKRRALFLHWMIKENIISKAHENSSCDDITNIITTYKLEQEGYAKILILLEDYFNE